ncbi:MAG: hypothetical protein HYV27_24260 [Candidatus Hydrogenedentes bacterium]|nr:hypothetical protein [Candidatus Hydrogenedentota bacterium]
MAEQNYSNHKVTPMGTILPVLAALIGGLLILAGLFYPNTTMGHCLLGTGALLNCLATSACMFVCRTYAVTLQDRIVRTETRVRLKEVLPAPLKDCVNTLTKKQLIGIRFASDEELPALTQKVLDERIESADAIKKLVKHWLADNDRV